MKWDMEMCREISVAYSRENPLSERKKWEEQLTSMNQE